MKPAAFAYAAPDGLDEVLGLLARYGGDAKLVAGGQSLVPMLNLRLARPEVVIDLNRVPGLAAACETEGGGLTIGALLRQRRLEAADGPGAAQPLLGEAVRHIGHVATRSRGTVGGSLAHADPAAELPAAMLALDAELVLHRAGGERIVPADRFFQGVFATALEPDELLFEIRLPPVRPRSGASFVELARRHGDFAMVGVACHVTFRPDGAIATAALALAGVDCRPLRIAEAEALLVGEAPRAAAFAAAGAVIGRTIDPASDLHATAAYRRSVAPVLVERSLAAACGRAAGVPSARETH